MVKNFKYHYFYKITNLINGFYYYGIHSTNDINDGYMGSGRKLKNAYKIFGKKNFVKEILKYFDSRQEASVYESLMVNEKLIHEENCYNMKIGGDYGTCIGSVLVIDENGNWLRCFKDDENYLNGKYKPFMTNMVAVFNKNKSCYEIIDKKTFYSQKENYITASVGKVTVKDKNNNTLQVSLDDERYLNGELVPIWLGRKHSESTKKKISEAHKIKQYQKGEKNSQFGTCWITKDGINKKIKKEEIEIYILEGWNKGRVCKKINN